MKMNFWHKGKVSDEDVYTFNELQKFCKISCSRETSSDSDNWIPENPLHGHCAIIAILIQKSYGGNIMRASLEKVCGYEQMRSHYWNLLPNGTEVDVSSGQFRGDDRNLVPAGKTTKNDEVITVKSLLVDESTAKRYTLFEKKFLENINGPKKGCSDCKNCSKKKCKGD